MVPMGVEGSGIFVMRDTLVERDQALEEAKKPLSTAEEIPGYVWAKPKGNAADKAGPRSR